MYASQTKRLCVREASSDDSRVHPTSKSHTQQNNMTGNTLTNGNTNQHYKGPNDPWVVIRSYRTNLIDSIDELDPGKTDYQNLEILLDIINQITGSKDKKLNLVGHPKFIRLINLMQDAKSSPIFKSHLALLFCSIAKSSEVAVLKLIDLSIHEVIYSELNSDNQPLVEACLRCLRAIVIWKATQKSWKFYNYTEINNQNNDEFQSKKILEKILTFASPSQTVHAQECISDIFAFTCLSEIEQKQLYHNNALTIIHNLLKSISPRVIISAVNWLTKICANSREISQVVYVSGFKFMDQLKDFMLKDNADQLQYVAACCYTIIYKNLPNHHRICDSTLTTHVLSCLVKLVKVDKPAILRCEAAKCLGYLIEDDKKLQATASICDHLIESLVKMLDYERLVSLVDKQEHDYQHYDELVSGRSLISSRLNFTRGGASYMTTIHVDVSCVNDPRERVDIKQEMKQAAFYALAILGSADEMIRKKISNNSPVMQHLVKNLSESNDKTLEATLTCLLSLSRSVEQLRTTFVESSVYSALKQLLGKTSDNLLTLVLSIVINVSVEFSPGKIQFTDDNTIKTVCDLTRSHDAKIKLHGIWILMSLTYQEKNPHLKLKIIQSLGMAHIADLLEKEADGDIVMKTLGFLRNILTIRNDIDTIMSIYGEQIIKSLIHVLESKDTSREVQEQTICVLQNIADGSHKTKEYLMNGKVLNYLANVIGENEYVNITIAAILCVTNLIHAKFDGCLERQIEMRKYKMDEKILALMDSPDPELSDKVRTAHNQFVLIEKKKSIAD